MSKIRPNGDIADTNSILLWLLQKYMRWGLIGLTFVGLHLLFILCSPAFTYGRNPLEKPTLIAVALGVSAGILYLACARLVLRELTSKTKLTLIIAVGAVIRIAMLSSTPVYEDDHYRYLWDGAIVANGMNPYAYTPNQVLEAAGGSGAVPTAIRKLSNESGDAISRINHPHLRTIYPPVAQVAFATAYQLQPWSLRAWRTVLLAFDSVTLVIIIIILRTLSLPASWVMLYYWNPVLLKEIFNSGHMDVVVLPFVLGAILLSAKRKYEWSAVLLAVAMGAKIWPIALLPIILRPALDNFRRLIASLALFAVIACAMFLPVYAAGLDNSSGFIAYGQRWEMNDSAYMIVLWVSRFLLKAIGLNSQTGRLVARAIIAAAVAAWISWLARKKSNEPAELFERCLLAVAAVFLLSPTQYPWYYTWMIPFLAIRPRTSLLLLTATLPLYYLRFYFDARGKAGIFDYGIVWLEYVPVWCMIIAEWHKKRRAAAALAPAEGLT